MSKSQWSTDTSRIRRVALSDIWMTLIRHMLKNSNKCSQKIVYFFALTLFELVSDMTLIWHVSNNSHKYPKKKVFFFASTHLMHSLDKSQIHLKVLKMCQSKIDQWRVNNRTFLTFTMVMDKWRSNAILYVTMSVSCVFYISGVIAYVSVSCKVSESVLH